MTPLLSGYGRRLLAQTGFPIVHATCAAKQRYRFAMGELRSVPGANGSTQVASERRSDRK
jgi:hypothetical protein